MLLSGVEPKTFRLLVQIVIFLMTFEACIQGQSIAIFWPFSLATIKILEENNALFPQILFIFLMSIKA